ncbi:hypothetical protein [Streptomyces sp. SGAir0957]
MTETTGETAGVVRLIGMPDLAWTDQASAEFARDFFELAGMAGMCTEPDPFDADLEAFGDAASHAVADLDGEVRRGAGAAEVLMAICVFVGAQGAVWAVPKVCDALWAPLRQRLAALIGARSSSVADGAQPSHRITLRTVVGPARSVVEVTLEIGPQCDAAALADIAERLQRQSLAEIGDRDRPGTVVSHIVAQDGTAGQRSETALPNGDDHTP